MYHTTGFGKDEIVTLCAIVTEKEAYSRGGPEVESDDGCDGLWECVDGAAVVGVGDAPCFEVRDGSFDDIADFVDGGVEFLFPVEEAAMGGLLDGGDHSASLVAFVADPVGGVEGVEDAGDVKAVGVVTRTVDGIQNS